MDLLRQQTKNSLKQAFKIFQTIYSCVHSSTLPLPIKNLLLLTNIILNLVFFFSIPTIEGFDVNELISSPPLLIILIVTYLIILIQIVICYEYGFQLFLCIQIQVYRNILGPLLIKSLLYQEQINSFIPREVNKLLLFTYYFSMCFLLSFFHQQRQKNSISILALTKSFYRFQNQALLYCISSNISSQVNIIFSIIFFVYSFFQFKKVFHIKSYENSIQQKLESLSSVLFFYYAAFLSLQSFSQQIMNIKEIIACCILLFLYLLIVVFFRKPQSSQYKDIVRLIESQTKQVRSEQGQKLIDTIQVICSNLNSILHQNRFDKIIQSQFTQFWLQHQKICKNIQCIQQGSKIHLNQLINSNDIGILNFKFYMSEVAQKIINGIYNIDPTNVKILLSILRFYITCLPSRRKALKLISQIAIFQQNLTFSQKYFYYESKQMIEKITSEELTGQLNFDKELFQFESTIYLMTTAIGQFWTHFLDEKINLDKLIQLNSKIQPYRQKIQDLVKYMIKRDNFSTLKMYQIYSEFCQTIQNNKLKQKLFLNLQAQTKKILQQRRQLQFLSFDSQLGIVAISLSQSSLGQIRMINTQANMMFGYVKDELKGKRVNQIMSQIHSRNHDDILGVFLQNYKKTINTNQRYLLGKNKKGYMFPIYLQLQKTCGDNLKQLTFIANIKQFPLKSSFIACVIDEQGQIKQVSSMFKNIFFFSKNNTIQAKGRNIQELINDFFCLGNQTEISQRIVKVQHKYYGKLDMKIQIQKLSFPKKKLAGYIVTFRIINPLNMQKKSHANLTHLSLTKNLIQIQKNDKLLGYQMKYNQEKNVYQLQKNPAHSNFPQVSRFTLPYINMKDIGDAFIPKNQQQQTKLFSHQIKTIRLRNGYFQRAQDNISFYSQEDLETRQKNQIKQNIDIIKGKNQDENFFFISFGKVGYFIFFLLSLLFVIFKFNEQISYSIQNQNCLFKMEEKYKVRKFLAQYVSSYQLLRLDPNNQYLQNSLLLTHQSLINSIKQSQISQKQKENILKVDFLKQAANLTYFFQTQLVSFDFTLPNKFDQIQIFSNLLIGLVCLQVLLAFFIYFTYVNQLEQRFLSLLIIDNKLIKKAIQKCAKLSINIENSIKNICQSEDSNNKKLENKFFLLNDQEQENQNPIKMTKKSISKQKIVNIPKLICFLIPAFLFLIYMIFSKLSLKNDNNNFSSKVTIFQSVYQAAPQSNIALMNAVLKYSSSQNILLTNQFTRIYQTLDSNIKEFEETNPNYVGKSLFTYYLKDICTNSKFSLNKSKCIQIEQGILQYGLSPTFNSYIMKIIDLQNSGNDSISSQKLNTFQSLFILQNQFVLKVIETISSQLYQKIISDSKSFQTFNKTVFYIAVIMLLLKLIYVLIYPFQAIKFELSTSNLLKNIIPSEQNDIQVQTFDQQKFERIEAELFQ